MIALVVAICSLGAAEAETDTTLALNVMLDAALVSAWEVDDPRPLVRQVLLTMFKVDPQHALEPTRTAARRLAGRMHDSPQGESVFATLAEVAAPHDRALRDELLALAIEESTAALAHEKLWIGPDKDKVSQGFPTLHVIRQRARQNLQLSVRLWPILLEHAQGDGDALTPVTKLFADARAAGGYSACAWVAYEDLLAAEFVRLDAQWSLEVLRKEWGETKLAKFCGDTAHRRWLDGERDEATRKLVLFSIENGVYSLQNYEMLAEIDAERAWRWVSTYTLPVRDAQRIRRVVFQHYAWHDVDAALAVAEAEQDETRRRDFLRDVAEVWAHRRPESIERVTRRQDNEVLRVWARAAAFDELERRARGQRPATKAEVLRDGYQTASTTPKFRRRYPRSNHPEEVRILEHPSDITWLVGRRRQEFLNQAAAITYAETGADEGIREIVAHLTDAGERDQVWRYCAEFVARDDLALAAKFHGNIEDPTHRVYATCVTAHFAAQRERDGY